LYTDFQSGRTAAIARHVSFAQITCFVISTSTRVIARKDSDSSSHCVERNEKVYIQSQSLTSRVRLYSLWGVRTKGQQAGILVEFFCQIKCTLFSKI